MRRRTFLGFAASALAAEESPSVSITMDDFNWSTTTPVANDAILGHLRRANTQAALFVIGKNVESEDGRRLLSKWNDAGHVIGNHTYSHPGLSRPNVTPSGFCDEIVHTEKLLSAFPNYRKLVRFPFLDEGNSAEKRDAVRGYLHLHGYRNAHITIDASDWYYSGHLESRVKADAGFKVERYREPYLAHLWDRAQYYDGLSRSVLGRSVPHTILVHFNLINALFLGDILAMFKERGWRIRNVSDAYRDKIFSEEPKTLPAGQSLIWAFAKAAGKPVRYPGEDGEYEKPKLDRLGL